MNKELTVSPLTMEQLDQDFGLVCYQTKVAHIEAGSLLILNKVHDFAWVYVDDVL